MLHYPPVLTKVCQHCGASVILERQGSGRPLEGRLDYWYTTEHRCAEGDRAIEGKENEGDRHELEELALRKRS